MTFIDMGIRGKISPNNLSNSNEKRDWRMYADFAQILINIARHTLIDLRGSIPTFIKITDLKVHDVNILDDLIPEPGSFYVMDRGYLDQENNFTISYIL